MTARTITVNAIMANVSTTLIMKEGEVPNSEQVFRAAMQLGT